MLTHKTCSFFGHRNFIATEEAKQKIKNVLEDLIIKENVRTFLFGSKSEFDYFCCLIVSELKEKYHNLKRVSYTCKNETCILEEEKEKWIKIYFSIFKKPIDFLCFDDEFYFKNKFTAGRASYVERNQAMIDDSDFCVFYYNQTYKPNKRKYSKRSNCYYQPKSGTAIAYAYAVKKKKNVFNLFTL